MDRQQLEDLSHAELQTEVRRYGLEPQATREALIDQIMSHLERNGPLNDLRQDATTVLQAAGSFGSTSTSGVQSGSSREALPQICAMFAEQMKQQQAFMQQLIAAVTAGQSRSQPAPSLPTPPTVVQATLPPRNTILSAVSPGQAIKLLASQVPEFSGAEDDDVNRWIQKVEQVSRIHGASDDITLLAATGKLTKIARRWFDSKTGVVNQTWPIFKQAVISRFQRETLVQVTLHKVEARRWNYPRETFQEYAMDKTDMLHSLNLPDRDVINYLVSGINNMAIKSAAAALPVDNVDDFLKRMHNITASFSEPFKKAFVPPQKIEKDKAKPINGTSVRNSPAEKPVKDLFCVYCKRTGHVRDDCFRLKRKEQGQRTATPSTPATVAAAKEDDPSASPPQVVGAVSNLDRTLEISDTHLKVVAINGRPCNLIALLDTGSPCSFVHTTVFERIFDRSSSSLVKANRSLVAINGLPIKTMGTVASSIQFESLPDFTGEIEFLVLQNNVFTVDLVIGRDFLRTHQITVLYSPKADTEENKLELLQHVASADVVDETENSILSYMASVEIDFDGETKKSLLSIIDEVENTEVAPVKDDYAVRVSLKDDSTYAFAPRRFAWAERQQIREITDDLLKRGIIKHSISPYCARVVPVRKRNGALRLCVDLRPLNSRVNKQKYPFPIIEDCIARLGNNTIFTSLDIQDGFHNIPVHPEHTKYFSFATPDGQFEFTRLPFGYCEAPAEFQKRLVHILQPLIREDRVLVYIDDILIPSASVTDNLATLKEVLLLLKRHAFQVNYKKCHFLKTTIEYLGYVISPNGITLSPRHVEAVLNFPLPKNINDLQRFLGLTGYFRKFIQDYASIAKPLRNLLRKAIDFNFDSSCLEAFNALKNKLISYPVLRVYNPKVETELHTDASAHAVAGILMQKQESGKWAPIAYYSQATNQAEAKYHSFELEMLAIVKSVERFHLYLYGLDFTIVTDCNALVYAVNKAHLNPRIARWALRLQNYKFKVVHRAGHRMTHVDALSRISAYVGAMPIERELEYKQLLDDRLKILAEELEFAENEKFELIDGLVFRKCADKPRFVIPDSMINNIIRIYHDEMAHCGVEKTVQGIGSNYWFPSLRKKVRSYVDNCLTCLTANSSVHTREGEMQEVDSPKRPFQIVHCDHFGPLTDTSQGFKYILVLVDAYTRFTWLFPAKTTSSRETIKHLLGVFNVFGFPNTLVSDRGTAFTSQEFLDFTNSKKIYHRLVAVAAPWSNGLVERVNKFLKSSLKKLTEEPKTWNIHLDKIQYVMNNTHHASLNASPSKLLLGYDQKRHADADIVESLNQIARVELCCNEERENMRTIAEEVSNKIRNYNKIYYDKKHAKPTKYQIGDYVLIRDTASKPGEDKKLKANYKGPYVVAKILNKNRYVIKDIPGFNITSRPYDSILSPDRLKPWIKPVNSE